MTTNMPPARIRTVAVHARGEQFRVARVEGNLFVCSKESGSCCCGWDEKGRMPFANGDWASEWERRGIRTRVHLTMTGCLGPCIAGNNALLQIFGESIWLKDLNRPELVSTVFDYVDDLLLAGRIVDPPRALAEHVYRRYLAPPGSADAEGEEEAGSGLERLDPVCLMDVDPATAVHKEEYGGRVIYFCAPSCKKQFLANPAAFMS